MIIERRYDWIMKLGLRHNSTPFIFNSLIETISNLGGRILWRDIISGLAEDKYD